MSIQFRFMEFYYAVSHPKLPVSMHHHVLCSAFCIVGFCAKLLRMWEEETYGFASRVHRLRVDLRDVRHSVQSERVELCVEQRVVESLVYLQQQHPLGQRLPRSLHATVACTGHKVSAWGICLFVKRVESFKTTERCVYEICCFAASVPVTIGSLSSAHVRTVHDKRCLKRSVLEATS